MNITIPFKVYEQIQFYVDKSSVECSGLGKVVITPEGYKVTEIVLLKQENTSTHTEIDAQAVTKAMYELRDSAGGVYFWWHSHVNMGVFWSGTDVDTIEEIGQNGLCVAVVFNKKKEMKGAVWLKGSELSPNLYFDDIPVNIEHEGADEATKALWAKSFDEKCKEKEYKFEYKGVSTLNPLRIEANDFDIVDFDIVDFEKKLSASDQHHLSMACNDLMYGYSINEVDKALHAVLEIIKATKADKHEKKKAYKYYKEMALEQKNYLIENEKRFEEMERMQ